MESFSFGQDPGIYVLFIEGLVYVGSSKNVYSRLIAHRNKFRSKAPYKERPRIQEVYNKANEDNYRAEVYKCSIDELDIKEKEITLKYQELYGDRCVNISFGKDHSKETIEKMSRQKKAYYKNKKIKTD